MKVSITNYMPFSAGPTKDSFAVFDRYGHRMAKVSTWALNREDIANMLAASGDMYAALEQCLAYIEMKTAYTRAMSVDQILAEVDRVKLISRVEIAHHLGCEQTTRSVDLAAARAALAKARGEA